MHTFRDPYGTIDGPINNTLEEEYKTIMLDYRRRI